MKSYRKTLVWMMLALAGAGSGRAATVLPKPDLGGVPPSKLYDYGVMGPPATKAIVAAAAANVTTPMAPGPVQPTWESIQANYQTPAWFEDAKFGLFMHWGIYSVAAHGPSAAEWYEKHMYQGDAEWHTETFGPIDKVGYKNLIPLFTAAKWDPDAWAKLFKESGAKFVIPTAEHHDNFALWNSNVTPYNAMRMGPQRDLIGDLAAAVRKQGLKFGVSNHGMENFTFVNPTADLDAQLQAEKADLYDPQWEAFYNVADRSDAAMTRFLTDWVNRNVELIDKYQPDILWFDNGVNLRVLDPLKEWVAAYYYNRALQWGKAVSLSTKYIAYAPSNDDTKQVGSILDFEKIGQRSPAGLRSGQPWMVDQPIGSTWGYSTGMSVSAPGTVIGWLVDTVSKGGTLLLNLSPMADGTLPQKQQDTLRGVGAWLDVNGEAIYGTRPWTKYIEGSTGRGQFNYHFSTKGNTLYAIASGWPSGDAVIASLGTGQAPGKVDKVELLGHDGALEFTQEDAGLKINLPEKPKAGGPYVFKISGLDLGAANTTVATK